ncbi:HTH domain-containing protein [Cytobacillus purgationiresistens]|uniref:Uncharacterized protein n=1 Tax=Cytobacillus purgationiresistens TaxID=863449 RepID=A0ABU0AF80_9BACI|nr:HTH domain-containing protein [Cytobacillus purgationiresistens]MDQ0269919.1 hypothetical protein [Cytobacillus purgationiresistens]
MESIKLEDNIEVLKNIYKMSDDLLDSIIGTKKDSNEYYESIEISTLLTHMDSIDETERLYFIIDSLHNNLGLSYETLAIYSKVSTQKFKDFLNDPNKLNENEKFTLAVRIMLLHFIFKEKYLIDN